MAKVNFSGTQSKFIFNQINGPIITVQKRGQGFRVTVSETSVDVTNNEFSNLKGLITAELASYNPKAGLKSVESRLVNINSLEFSIDDNRLQAFLDALQGL